MRRSLSLLSRPRAPGTATDLSPCLVWRGWIHFFFSSPHSPGHALYQVAMSQVSLRSAHSYDVPDFGYAKDPVDPTRDGDVTRRAFR